MGLLETFELRSVRFGTCCENHIIRENCTKRSLAPQEIVLVEIVLKKCVYRYNTGVSYFKEIRGLHHYNLQYDTCLDENNVEWLLVIRFIGWDHEHR